MRPPIVTIKKLHSQNPYRKLANARSGRSVGDSGRSENQSYAVQRLRRMADFAPFIIPEIDAEMKREQDGLII